MSRRSSRMLEELADMAAELAHDCHRRALTARTPSEGMAFAKVAREAADSARESLALKATFDRDLPRIRPRPLGARPASPAPKDVH